MNSVKIFFSLQGPTRSVGVDSQIKSFFFKKDLKKYIFFIFCLQHKETAEADADADADSQVNWTRPPGWACIASNEIRQF